MANKCCQLSLVKNNTRKFESDQDVWSNVFQLKILLSGAWVLTDKSLSESFSFTHVLQFTTRRFKINGA